MNTLLLEKEFDGKALAPVTAQLAAADRLLQQEKAVCLLLRSVPWVLAFIVAAFLTDVLLHLPSNARLAIDLGFLLLALALAVRAAWVGWVRRNAFEHTARILEARDATLGSKLINILQLRAQATDSELAPLTRAMARYAVAGYAGELHGLNLVRLARTDLPKAAAKRAGVSFLVFAGVLGVFLGVTRTEVPRFADPFGDHPPFSFTRLEITDPGDDSHVVVYGQSFTVTAKASGHRPGELFLSYFPAAAPAQVTTVPMFDKSDRGFSQQIENVQSELTIFVHTKNRHSISRQRRVGIVLTPKLERSWVKITPPAYTALPPEEKALQFKPLKALAGSTLEFRLQSNRPLSSGKIEVIKGPGEVRSLAMTPGADREVSGTLEATDSSRLRFSVTDIDQHPSQETWELALTVTHDLAPEVQITNPSGDSFVAMDFVVEATVEASDDYGVRTLRIHQARNGEWGEPRIAEFKNGTRNVRDGFTLNLAEMQLASGDTISFFAEAIDTAPEPHLARSQTVTLTVITTEEYNQFLREQIDLSDIQAKYSDLTRQLQELIEEQKKLGDEAQALREQLEKAPGEQARGAAEKKLDQLLGRQNEVNQQLNKLADRMDEFVRKDPLYDIESELQETLREKAEQIRESTAANGEASQQIADSTPSPTGAPQADAEKLGEFKKASDEQLEKLGATKEQTESEVLEPLADMSLLHEIMKDLNRFKELYEAQKQVAEQVKAYDRPAPLSRDDQLALKELAGREREIAEQLDAVEQKLFEDGKAAEEKFPKAAESAQEIAESMGDLRLRAHAENATEAMLGGRGDQAAQLAARLRDEMEKLFAECNSQGGQMAGELDQYLRLSRSMNPGNNFKQMLQCRKFGDGDKPGMGMGRGPAGMGADGFAVSAGENPRVLGNETAISQKSEVPSSKGRSEAVPAGAMPEVAVEKPDTMSDVNAVNRESEAVQGETTIEQYSDVVERYFKAIAK